MKLKELMLIVTTFAFASVSFAQTVPTDDVDKATQRKIKKQILVSDLENRIRELSLAAPRVMARYRIAQWLWTDGKDDIGRAEEFAVAAVDDMYKNRVEVPPVYYSSLSADLFALLDRHSPSVSKTLKEKYKFTSIEEGGVQDSLLGQPGGERAAVDAAIRSLYAGDSADYQLPTLLSRLRQRNSPELFRLLDNLIAAEERVPGRLSSATLTVVTPYFGATNVQSGTSRRFAQIVLGRSRAASQLPFADFDGWLDIVNSNMPMITERAPNLVPESGVIRAVLASRISQQSRDARERNERINNSIDKLGTLVDEAEKAQDPLVKYDLYRRAAKLALEKGLYKRSADLSVLFGDVDVSTDKILVQTQKNEVGQMLEAVVEKALKNEDDKSALYAVDRFSDNDRRANGYAAVSKFYIDKGDRDSARTTMENAIRATGNVESLPRRASVYFKLIPITHAIDPTSVFEINALAAKSINTIPSLNVEDKPETEKFQNHVSGLMVVSWNLLPMLSAYTKEDRNGAADLSGRIEKKEVKVFADFSLGVAALDDDKKTKPTSNRLDIEN